MKSRTYDQSRREAMARRSRHLFALARPELLRDADPRSPAAGPVSMAVKLVDPETRALIDAALARRPA